MSYDEAAAHGSGEGLLARPVQPRSVRVHEAALDATRELLAEGGLPAATMDAVTERSGVSKATLYKHWPSRTALAAEAFGRDLADAAPPPDTGDTVRDLSELMRSSCAFYAGPEGRVYAQLLAASVGDEGGAAYFRAFFLHARRRAVATVWERAVTRGETRDGIDADTATDLLFGPVVFRLLAGHRPLTAEAGEDLARAAMSGLLDPLPPTDRPAD